MAVGTTIRARFPRHATLRVTNDDIDRNLEGVLETIAMKLRDLRPRDDISENAAAVRHA
jgi:hypothetical protein